MVNVSIYIPYMDPSWVCDGQVSKWNLNAHSKSHALPTCRYERFIDLAPRKKPSRLLIVTGQRPWVPTANFQGWSSQFPINKATNKAMALIFGHTSMNKIWRNYMVYRRPEPTRHRNIFYDIIFLQWTHFHYGSILFFLTRITLVCRLGTLVSMCVCVLSFLWTMSNIHKSIIRSAVLHTYIPILEYIRGCPAIDVCWFVKPMNIHQL